jgi:hypothetical protein
MDAQRLRRARLIAVHLFENAFDVFAFQFLEGQPRAVDAGNGGGRRGAQLVGQVVRMENVGLG